MQENISKTYAEKDILKKYKAIFQTNINNGFETDLLNRGFLFQYDEKITNPDIPFLAINPSYKQDEEKVKGSYSQFDGLEYPYFKAFYKILSHLENEYKAIANWSHLDLISI